MESTVSDLPLDLFSLFEMMPDLVFVVDKEGYVKKANHAAIEKLGYSKEELFSKPISAFIFHEDLETTRISRDRLLDGKQLTDFENRYVTRDGEIIWLYWTSFYIPEFEIVFAIAKDISERKIKEEEIEEKYKKFKALSEHFKSTIEKERKYFSIELHEELAQLASVILMDIHTIKRNMPDMPEIIKSRIEHAADISKLLIQTIRRIAFEMSPYMLDQLGLNETLKWLCNDFTILNQIPCDFESSYDEKGLTQEIKIDFFRICQESLSNVMNHACASSVKISIKEEGNMLRLSITDDGKGFEVKRPLRTSGLANIRERVASINGKLVIQSEIQKGTSVTVTLQRPQSELLLFDIY